MTVALLTLPLFLAGLVLVSGVIGFIEMDLALKHKCREGGLWGQKKVAPLLQSLLVLNPRALELRRRQAEAALEVAEAAGNPVLLAKATAKSLQIYQERQVLDQKQKILIQQSNLLLSTAHAATQVQLRKKLTPGAELFLKTTSPRLQGRAPRLAVKASDPDLAPTYGTTLNFAKDQALAHSWNYGLRIQPPFAYFLPGSFNFEITCAVTLAQEGEQWLPKIITGKFLSKPAW